MLAGGCKSPVPALLDRTSSWAARASPFSMSVPGPPNLGCCDSSEDDDMDESGLAELEPAIPVSPPLGRCR